MAARKTNGIYQLKITLLGLRPPLWRRVLVKSNTSLDVLHEVIQGAMGWWDCHLHAFSIGGIEYGRIDPDFGLEDTKDETRMTLNRVVTGEKSKFRYTYDFGDGWEHEILLEKILPVDPAQPYPVCIKGKRACPPEDCGGIWGYQELIEIMADPQHPEYEERLDWLEEPLEPEQFDLDEVNAALRRLSR